LALIPREMIENIRINTDIVALISEYVRLEKKGRNYSGLCPFHHEAVASFTVSPEKQIFYCFGCQAGGNAFKFIMLAENLTFREAVHRLAERAGIFLPDFREDHDDKRAAREERVWQANARAAEFYHNYLLEKPAAARAREYLASRGLSPEIVKTFKIGYAPAAWDALAVHMRGLGYSREELVDAGLLSGDEGRFFDRFRNRIIFPVANPQGKVVAFGGRLMESSKKQPKYLNTAETPFFNKSRVLFGLNLARQAIKQEDYAVIMEGYMDVVTAHQFGVRNAIASMGTSLTAEQGKILRRYTRDVYIAYDADTAGVKAAARGLDILQQLGCPLKVISMPKDTDPDDFFRKYGAEEWKKLVVNAETLLEYKLRLAQEDGKDPAGILSAVLPNLAEMKSGIELEDGVRLVASRLNLSWEAVKSEIKRFEANERKIWVKTDKNAKNIHSIVNVSRSRDALLEAEKGILQVLVANPEKLEYFKSALGNEFLQDPLYKELYRLIADQIDAGVFDPSGLLDGMEEQAVAVLSEIIIEETEKKIENDTEKAIDDYINVIKRNEQARKRAGLMQELARAEKNNDIETINNILIEMRRIDMQIAAMGKGD